MNPHATALRGPALTDADVKYIRRCFSTLSQACEGRDETPEQVLGQMRSGELPAPTYLLEDGTPMVPPDYFALVDQAGGVANLRGHFAQRFRAAATSARQSVDDARVEQEWLGYLSGEYGACLKRVTPEAIFQKETLVEQLTARLAAPSPQDPAWCVALRDEVDALDALERAFAPWDRLRFGGPVSRDRLISVPRQLYPAAFDRR